MNTIESGLTEEQKKVAKLLLDTAIKLSSDGIGSISVFNIGKEVKYDDLFEKDIEPFNILESPRRFEILSAIDGACIINSKGKLISYSAMIKNSKPYRGFGTRHAASFTASMNHNLVVMTSEEDRKVRVFKNGLLIMQIDPTDKEVKKKTREAVSFLEAAGAGIIGTLGVSMLLPTIGITLIPGIILFGSSHYLIKLLLSKEDEAKPNV